jgi:hypothetical protein
MARADQIARDALMLAAIGRMPDEFWLTDRRVGRACAQLGWTRTKARGWAKRLAARIRARRGMTP